MKFKELIEELQTYISPDKEILEMVIAIQQPDGSIGWGTLEDLKLFKPKLFVDKKRFEDLIPLFSETVEKKIRIKDPRVRKSKTR